MMEIFNYRTLRINTRFIDDIEDEKAPFELDIDIEINGKEYSLVITGDIYYDIETSGDGFKEEKLSIEMVKKIDINYSDIYDADGMRIGQFATPITFKLMDRICKKLL